jgi:hypothetical protein
MIRRTLVIPPAILGAGISFLAACQSHRERPPAASPAPASEPAPFAAAETKPSSHVWEARGVRVTCPPGWQEKKDPDFELFLVPPGAGQSSGDDARITFDVPDLPPHMPWMIQMSRVEHDYEADLKKAHPDVKFDTATDIKLPNTVARLVQSSWHQNGIVHEDTALLMIHASGVYILDAQAGGKQLPPTRAAFESMRASLQWTK